MSYNTKEETLKILPKMVDADAVELDWPALIAFCDNYIDGRLRGFFAVPFSTSTNQADEPSIREMARMLYAGMAQNIRYTEDSPARMPDNFFWKEGRRMLQQIRAGIIKLDLTNATMTTDTEDENAAQDVGDTNSDTRPIFNQGNELDWEETVFDEDEHKRVNPEDAW